MIVVTSVADDATKKAFPAGRTLSNLSARNQCPDERKAVLHTVGHLDRYKTHELKLKDVEPGTLAPKDRKEGECGCPYLAPIEDFLMKSQDKDFFEEMKKVEAARQRSDGKIYELGGAGAYASVANYTETSYGLDSEGKEIVLDRSPDYAANYPYMVISTNADFVPSHSAIYGERFTDFLRRFYFRHLVERPVCRSRRPRSACRRSVRARAPSDRGTCDRRRRPDRRGVSRVARARSPSLTGSCPRDPRSGSARRSGRSA